MVTMVGAAFGVRLVELFFLAAWLLGLGLVWRYTRHTLLLGVYLGCTLSWTHDWVMASPEMWRMDFHPDTVWLATWGERPEALWAPLSYGAFFGIGTLVWFKFADAPLRERLGGWRYLVLSPAIFAGNVIVEGAIIEWAHTNTYHQAESWLVFNIPWIHLLTTGVMFVGIVFFTGEALRILEHLGWREVEPSGVDPPSRPPTVASAETGLATAADRVPVALAEAPTLPRRLRLALLLVGVALPQAAFTAATLVGLYAYDWIAVPY